jgi:DNA-binding Xre family transcriptional regulator
MCYAKNMQLLRHGGYVMAVSYNKLWNLLVDKKMSKADLRRAADLSPNTLTKLRRDEPVAMIVLEKICSAIDADFGDIVQYVAEEKS